MGTKLKRLVRKRMEKTDESYVTALRRVRECADKIRIRDGSEEAIDDAARETIHHSPPRRGA
jgi:hypothetical protein